MASYQNGTTWHSSLCTTRRKERQKHYWSGNPTHHWNRSNLPATNTITGPLPWPMNMFWSDGWGLPQISMPSSWSRWHIPHACTHQAMKYYIQHKFGVCFKQMQHISTTPMAWSRTGSGWCSTKVYCALGCTDWCVSHQGAPQLMQDPTTLLTIQRSLTAFIKDVVLHNSTNLCNKPKNI